MFRWILLGLILCGPATAQRMPLLGAGGPAISAPPAYTGLGDVSGWSTPYAYYGVYAFTAAIAAAGTQPMFDFTRQSDSHVCTIFPAPTGGLGNTGSCTTGGDNAQNYASFCAATTCVATKAYDQGGNGRDVANVSGPPMSFTGLSGKPAMACDAGTTRLLNGTGPGTIPTSPWTSIAAYQSNAADGTIISTYSGTGSFLSAINSTAQIRIYSGVSYDVSATNSTPHAVAGFASGSLSTSIINVDGTESATGNSGTGGLGANIWLCGETFFSSYMTGMIGVAAIYDGISTPTQRTNATNFLKALFGF